MTSAAPTGPTGPTGPGRRRLATAVIAGLALVGVLVAVQLVDEGDGAARHRGEPPASVRPSSPAR
ncbi:MAG: hypothetical protein WCI50_03660 [Actinomycetes bacterium]